MKKAIEVLRKSWIYIIGIAALLWFIIRVFPKPSRAAYPCQRAAFPLASAFLIWLTSSLFTFRFIKSARAMFRENRVLAAAGLVVAGGLLFAASNWVFPARELLAGAKDAMAEAPVLVKSYNANTDQFIDPSATVSIVKSEAEDVFTIGEMEVEEMVREAVALAGGLEGIISDGQTVVLKPNIVTDTFLGEEISTEANGMVTDWRVVAAVAKMVREINPTGEILVIEGSAAESTQAAYQVLNYTKAHMPEVDEFLGIEESSGAWQDYDSDELSSVLLSAEVALYGDYKLPNGAAPYYYNKRYFEADVIISIPVLKNHETAGVTGAVKNMGIGGTPTNIYGNSENANGRWEVIDHQASELHKFIHDFYYGCPADFAVMDGIQGYSNGPNTNNGPRFIEGHQEGMGLILASSDPLAMDAIASLVMFDSPSRVPYLVTLNNDGVGCADPMAIRVEGVLVSDVKKPFPLESNGTSCNYTDDRPPNASFESIIIEDQVLKVSLSDLQDITRLDIQLDEQILDQFIVGDFGYFELDLNAFDLTDSMLTLYAHDRYMNTQLLSASFKQSPATGLESQLMAGHIKVWPNPVISRMNVEISSRVGGRVQYMLYNMTGQLQLSQQRNVSAGVSVAEMDMSAMKPGHYLLLIETPDERYSVPVVKQ